MNPTSLLWRDLALGVGTAYRMRTLDGWEALPASRYDKQVRVNAHGAHPSPVWADERIVTVEGWCWSSTARDALLAAFRARMTFEEDTEPLTITVAGLTLTAGAQLLEARPALLRGEWGIGRFGFLLQWRCPDPLRYGPPRTVSTPLPLAGGGLTYSLYTTGFLDYGPAGTTGQLTLTNAGSAAAPILFAVTGGLDQGYEITAAGGRLTYPVPVPARQVIELDTAAGTVLVEGTASRRGNLTNADWLSVPRADPETGDPGELLVQFTSLGGARDAAAELAATVQDTYW